MDNAPSLPSPHLSAGSNLDDRERGVSPFRFLPSAPLRSYFSSGWAFLIPYLLVYLLYYWLKWSVNTSTAHVPSLLHVYWALHAANLILGAFALRAGWRQLRVPDFRFPTSIFLCWFLLALVFFIPGTYLEYPADPWTHLSRITEWATRSEVGAHSAWLKFPYFFSYSFLEQVPVEKQLFWLTIYYVGACLLL